MKKFLIGLLILIVISAAVAWFTLDRMALMQSQVDNNVQQGILSQEIPETRFEIVFCGTGSPQYNADRSQPCTGVIAGGRFFLFDAGQGAAQQLNATLAPYQKLDTIFLTHLHSDHMSGLGDVLHNGWLVGRQSLVEVIGPPGTQRVLDGIALSLSDDIKERQRVLGSEYVQSESALGAAREITLDGDEAREVFNKDGVTIRAFRVDHPDWAYSYGYRIEFGGKSIVISGDTKYTPAIARHAQNVDLLIHEVINLQMMEMAAKSLEKYGSVVAPKRMALISAVHTPTLEVARAAVEAKAKTLVLTHLIPPIPASSFVESTYIDGMDTIYDGKIVVARDGMRLTLIE